MNRHFSRGFTLVEALVALVVLSIGMLGIAALYVESLRAGRESLVRTQAINLAVDMADRIRANKDGRLNYIKSTTDIGAANSNCQQGGSGSSCTPAVMSANDISEWNTALTTSLPEGNGRIEVAAVPGSTTFFTYTIRVGWVETTQTVSYVLRMQT